MSIRLNDENLRNAEAVLKKAQEHTKKLREDDQQVVRTAEEMPPQKTELTRVARIRRMIGWVVVLFILAIIVGATGILHLIPRWVRIAFNLSAISAILFYLNSKSEGHLIRLLPGEAYRHRLHFPWIDYLTMLVITGMMVTFLHPFLHANPSEYTPPDLMVELGCVLIYFIPLAILLGKFGIQKPRLFCPQPDCGHFVPHDDPWVCGYCRRENQNARYFSFLNKCEHCESSPREYECPYCKRDILLGGTPDPLHRARKVLPVGIPTVAKPIVEVRKEQLEEVEFQVTLTRMKTALERAKREFKGAQVSEKAQNLSSQDKLEERAKASRALHTDVHRIADKEIKDAEEKFGDNPGMLDREITRIKSFVAEELGRVDLTE